MRIAAAVLIALLAAGAASAQTPKQVMGDFDADGKLDSASLSVKDGKFVVEAEFGGEARKHVKVTEGLAKDAPASIEAKRGAGGADVIALGAQSYAFKNGAFAAVN